MAKIRPYSIAFCGGAFGDEGKGRLVDEYVSEFSKKRKVILYRDNGGSNAGHTVEVNGIRIALHQLPSGIFTKNATIVLGKGMVLHPGDLLAEIAAVKSANKGKVDARIVIDEMAALSLDTHRAYETILKQWQEGGKGSTGRGIGPAYADILYRHPLRMRDLISWNEEKISKHYRLYAALINGLNGDLASTEVNTLSGKTITVGSEKAFIQRLKKQSGELKNLVANISPLLNNAWQKPEEYAFVFEKAQAVGLDPRYGVYPDVTASDCTFAGITSSTEGIVDFQKIACRAAVIKATYMSSVGMRKIPTLVNGPLADKIREDAHEYGATTKRPRDIAFLDLPAVKFFKDVGYTTHLVLTHMDIVYPDVPVKVCIGYKQNGKEVSYRPDQEFLLTVKPVYQEFAAWDKISMQKAKSKKEIPPKAKKFLDYVSKYLGIPILMITTGPERSQSIKM